MSKGRKLRDLVNERLVAAADEIFALFEKMIAEYEEELRRSKRENNQLLESMLSSRSRVLEDEETLAETPDAETNQESLVMEIKFEPREEQSVKEEEDQLPLSLPELSADCVKSEESSVPEQRQTELKDEDMTSEPQGQSVTREDTNNSDSDWMSAGPSFPFQQMETEGLGDPYNLQISDISTKLLTQQKSVPEMSLANNSGSSDVNQFSVCHQRFESNLTLQKRNKIPSETFHSCPICMQTFTRKFRLQRHMRGHANEKPYSCSVCQKSFGRLDCLRGHERLHTGEKPFKCSVCNKAFADSSNLNAHRRIHTGVKPYSCTICGKKFAQNNCLKSHMLTHTNEKNYFCPSCGKGYSKKGYLDVHMRCHTGEKPYVCSICFHAFSVNSNLTRHMKKHEEASQSPDQN